MEIFIMVLEIIGTIAFAVSGALTGMKKNMDIFGVIILAETTAVGGGIMRDLILGLNPPGTFANPVFAITATATAIITFLPMIRRVLVKNRKIYEIVMLVMDSLGLGIFTVVGIQTAYTVSSRYNIFLLIFVGVITGVGGGVLRDVIAGDTPYIFVKHIYACASIAGAVVCILLWKINSTLAILIGSSVIIVIRFLAAIFRWSLPKANIFDHEKQLP